MLLFLLTFSNNNVVTGLTDFQFKIICLFRDIE